MIGEEDYEVVDECMGEEEISEGTQNPQTVTMDCLKSDNIVQQSDNTMQQTDNTDQNLETNGNNID